MKITTNTYPENTAPLLESFFPIPCAWGRLYADAQQRVALVDLDQLQEHEAELLLSEAEREFLQRFRYPKRRREWLGGRVAAKTALLTLHEPEAFQQLTILPNEHGRPMVSGAAKSSAALSITHSGSYAAALAVQGASCGIDLQEISDKLPSLTGYFAAATELELLAQQPKLGSEETALTMLWAVKEAVKKSVLTDQPGIFAGITVERIIAVREHVWQFECAVQGYLQQSAMVYDLSPYVLALTITNNHA
ncbi:4'-phosphopantetheinyl transferase family protein [Candidatus Electronema sp. PJ]|uniref:4'-phosphopantetheinyl transferase family protein n=1 Tax=Candidatus Electronema sp. PJ TaxID=3401572 RepID=UPI003AA8B63C